MDSPSSSPYSRFNGAVPNRLNLAKTAHFDLRDPRSRYSALLGDGPALDSYRKGRSGTLFPIRDEGELT